MLYELAFISTQIYSETLSDEEVISMLQDATRNSFELREIIALGIKQYSHINNDATVAKKVYKKCHYQTVVATRNNNNSLITNPIAKLLGMQQISCNINQYFDFSTILSVMQVNRLCWNNAIEPLSICHLNLSDLYQAMRHKFRPSTSTSTSTLMWMSYELGYKPIFDRFYSHNIESICIDCV